MESHHCPCDGITLADGVLAVKGQKRVFRGGAETLVDVERSLLVPEDVDPEKIRARYEDGVLTLEISKREEAKPKTIQVQVAVVHRYATYAAFQFYIRDRAIRKPEHTGARALAVHIIGGFRGYQGHGFLFAIAVVVANAISCCAVGLFFLAPQVIVGGCVALSNYRPCVSGWPQYQVGAVKSGFAAQRYGLV
ncbi:MAG: hypothetical protein EBT95_08255, partial [Verrucomicrobia bacterium]|nr:hypothetical protein [Verrucomicrobiota bacterium]